MVDRRFPSILLAVAVAEALLAAAIILRIPFAVDLWPMEGTTRLSFLFLASIVAAGATGQAWCLVRREYAALVGVALDYVMISGPAAVFLFAIGFGRGDGGLIGLGVAFLASAAFGVAMFWWSRRFAIRDPRPMPTVVRWAFVVFIVALIVPATMMIFHLRDVMPWSVTDDGEVIYGMMFLGAAAYFAYGLARPSWHNAAGQLAAFLAYDLVLIVPFVQHFSRVPDSLRANLIVYVAVVSLSALLAVYYLFVNAETRSESGTRWPV